MLILIVLLLLHFKSSFSSSEQKIGLVSMIYKPKNIETWLELHRKLGIAHFYIRLERTPELVEYLRKQPDVTLEVASEETTNNYTTIMDRQNKMVTGALENAKKDSIDWLIHIDCDEVLSGNLNEIRNLPPEIRTFWMQNIEAVYKDIPTSDTNCFVADSFKRCDKEHCASYANGKGGGRVAPDVREFGPHRFTSHSKKEIKLESVVVQHFESCDYDQYLKKYRNLSVGAKVEDIPFEYYRESILNSDSEEKLKGIYKKYRVKN